MSWTNAAGLVVIIASVLLSAFFSGCETGVVSVNRIRLRHQVRSGDRRSERLARFLVRQEGVLAATLIGTNVSNVACAAIATAFLASRFGAVAPLLSTLLVTPFLLVFAEVVPKTYFRLRADSVMPVACGPLSVAMAALSPFVKLAILFANILFRLTGTQRRSVFVTREELKSIVVESAEKGALRLRERDMLHGVLDFGRTTVEGIMVPLRDVVSIAEAGTPDELKTLVRGKGHTRALVYRGRPDEIVGFVNVFDVLYSEEPGEEISRFVRHIAVVPEKKRLDRLLIYMLRNRVPIAVVVDEPGACIGIVTVEDIIEEIMGELADEHPSSTERRPGRL
ncbi:MAG: hemolysin family protein [Candidatus Eisenbacteria bacterium]